MTSPTHPDEQDPSADKHARPTRPTWEEQAALRDDLLRPYHDHAADDGDGDGDYARGLRDACNALLYREPPPWMRAD